MLEIKNLNKSFRGQQVLQDISTRFEPGKTSLVIGASGSGKTVFMKCIVGLVQADSGEVLYEGNDFLNMTTKKRQEIRKKIGMLFQGGALFDSMTVEQNVMFPLNMLTDMPSSEKKDRVNFCLERVNLEGKNDLYPDALSGGMKKRVGIARAISAEPHYLFCDEPNSGLDPQTSLVIDRLIEKITEELKITTIINTHDMNSVFEIGEKVVFLWEGKKWWEGAKDQIRKSGNQELKDFIFAGKAVREAQL